MDSAEDVFLMRNNSCKLIWMIKESQIDNLEQDPAR